MTATNATLAPPARRTSLADLVAREKKRARRRKIITGGALALLPAIIAVLWLAFFQRRPVPLSAQFRTQAITMGEVDREVRATGHVEAVTTVQVGAEISGRIETVDVDYNDPVKAGQVLARFDRASLAAQLAQAEATLAAARAALEQARTDRERTARDLVRITRLRDQHTIPDADFDNGVSGARLAEQRVSAAEAQVNAQQALLSVSRTSLEHTVIKAPIDGVVITRNIDPGQTVASVLQTPVLFTVAADLRKMRVVAAVDEADVGEVAAKQAATFTVTSYPDRVFSGIVTEVRSSPVIVQDVVTYGTVIEVDNLDLALRPGMTASARIRVATAKNVRRAPATALRFTPPGESAVETPGLWVLEGNRVERVGVRAGVSDGELVEVTEVAGGSLTPGRAVITELTPEGRKLHAPGH